MGTNYSEANYKKTYGGDYVKSYEDRREAKKLHDERARSYKETTQSVKPYNKKEKGKTAEQTTNTTATVLRPEGNKPASKRVVTPRPPVTKSTRTRVETTTPKPQETYAPKAEVVVPGSKETARPKVEVPPPFVAPKEEQAQAPRKQKQSTTRNYEVYRNMVTPPVMPLGNGKYREMSQKEEVDEREARKILSYADYKPKEQLNLLTFFIIAGVLGFSMSIFGPMCILAWGFLAKSKNTTSYEKKLTMGKLSVTLPATEQDKASYEKRAKLYINVGAVIGVIQLVRLLGWV